MHYQSTFHASAHRHVPTSLWAALTIPPTKVGGPEQCPLASFMGGCVCSCVGGQLFTVPTSVGNEAKLVNNSVRKVIRN